MVARKITGPGKKPENNAKEKRCNSKTDIGAQHENITMGKVKKHQNAVDHGVPNGDNSVKTSSLECIDNVLNKIRYQISEGFHTATPVTRSSSFC